MGERIYVRRKAFVVGQSKENQLAVAQVVRYGMPSSRSSAC